MDWVALINAQLTTSSILDGDDNGEGAAIQSIGDALQGIFERETRRRLGLTNKKELYDGQGTRFLCLSEAPIIKVNKLTVNGVTASVGSDLSIYPPPAAYVEGEEYVILTGGAVFACGIANVFVDYDFGVIEQDERYGAIVGAIAQWGARVYLNRGRQNVSSIDTGGLQTSYRELMPDIVKRAMSSCARVTSSTGVL